MEKQTSSIVLGVLALLQGLQLYMINDLRDRVVRIENQYIGGAYAKR